LSEPTLSREFDQHFEVASVVRRQIDVRDPDPVQISPTIYETDSTFCRGSASCAWILNVAGDGALSASDIIFSSKVTNDSTAQVLVLHKRDLSKLSTESAALLSEKYSLLLAKKARILIYKRLAMTQQSP